MADQVAEAVSIPVLHLADVIAEAVTAQGLDSVGFIGPSFAMSRDFFTARIASHGITVHVPDAAHHEAVNRIVYDELVHGKVLDASRRTVVGLVDELWDAGAKGLVLGTTELELLVKQADVELPLFPATDAARRRGARPRARASGTWLRGSLRSHLSRRGQPTRRQGPMLPSRSVTRTQRQYSGERAGTAADPPDRRQPHGVEGAGAAGGRVGQRADAVGVGGADPQHPAVLAVAQGGGGGARAGAVEADRVGDDLAGTGSTGPADVDPRRASCRRQEPAGSRRRRRTSSGSPTAGW